MVKWVWTCVCVFYFFVDAKNSSSVSSKSIWILKSILLTEVACSLPLLFFCFLFYFSYTLLFFPLFFAFFPVFDSPILNFLTIFSYKGKKSLEFFLYKTKKTFFFLGDVKICSNWKEEWRTQNLLVVNGLINVIIINWLIVLAVLDTKKFKKVICLLISCIYYEFTRKIVNIH